MNYVQSNTIPFVSISNLIIEASGMLPFVQTRITNGYVLSQMSNFGPSNGLVLDNVDFTNISTSLSFDQVTVKGNVYFASPVTINTNLYLLSKNSFNLLSILDGLITFNDINSQYITYGSSATLIYGTGGSFGRYQEWSR